MFSQVEYLVTDPYHRVSIIQILVFGVCYILVILEAINNYKLFSHIIVEAVLPGELSAKSVANTFWKKEVYQELDDLNIRNQWTFKKHNDNLSGTYDHAMEYADKI